MGGEDYCSVGVNLGANLDSVFWDFVFLFLFLFPFDQ